MNTWYEWLHFFLRGSHIVVGFTGLALFWVVISMQKGTPRHRTFGKCFVAIAYYVAGTALLSSCWALLHLETFAPGIIHLSEEAQIVPRSKYQFLFSILLFLAIATIAGATYGRLSVKYKENVSALRRTSLPIWQGLATLSAFGLAIFGIYHLIVGVPTGGLPWAAYWVPTILGGFGVSETIKEFRQVARPSVDSREWLYRHIEQMFGTGIAFHTAFLVFGASRFLGNYLPGPLVFVPWLAPLLIGAIATKWYIHKLKSKLNGEETKHRFPANALNPMAEAKNQ